MKTDRQYPGFTIVELLIVVVVIAVLAAITIVAYNGVVERAKASAAQTTAESVAKKLLSHMVLNADQVPADLATVGFVDSATTTFQYSKNTSASPQTFCVTVTAGNISYYIDNTTHSTPTPGACPGHGVNGVAAITNYHTNPGIEANTTGWNQRLSATFARATDQMHSGAASLRVTTPGAVADEGINTVVPTGSVVTGVAGSHVGSAWVKAPTGTFMRLFVERYSGSNIYIAGIVVPFTATGDWQRVSAIIPSVSSTDRVVVNVRTNAAVAVTFYIDDIMITPGDTLYTYADGASPNWVWNGTQYNATSTGPPL